VADRVDLGNVLGHLRKIDKQATSMMTEIKMSLERQHGHNSDMRSNGDTFFWALIIEAALFMAILAYQYRHIKVSFDNKLLL
jgi:hypothetical protein